MMPTGRLVDVESQQRFKQKVAPSPSDSILKLPIAGGTIAINGEWFPVLGLRSMVVAGYTAPLKGTLLFVPNSQREIILFIWAIYNIKLALVKVENFNKRCVRSLQELCERRRSVGSAILGRDSTRGTYILMNQRPMENGISGERRGGKSNSQISQ